MNRFGDRGGRRTIGAREIAMMQWEDKREAEKHRQEERSAMLWLNPSDLGDLAHHAPHGQIWMPKALLDTFFRLQRKHETNGQTLARLLREGDWHVNDIRKTKG